jgi:amidase
MSEALNMMANTGQFGLDILPCPSMLVSANGLPVGLMMVGRHFEDGVVLKAAHALETIMDKKL